MKQAAQREHSDGLRIERATPTRLVKGIYLIEPGREHPVLARSRDAMHAAIEDAAQFRFVTTGRY